MQGVPPGGTVVWGERLLWRGVSLYQCGRYMKVGDIFANKRFYKGKRKQRCINTGAPCLTPRSTSHALSPPTFSIFSTISLGIPRCRVSYSNMGGGRTKGFWAEHFRRKTMATPVRVCENSGEFLLTRTHSTLCTPFLLQLHSPPQPILPALLPSNPQAPLF